MDVTPWQNFGLAGMVIGALFLTIWVIGKSIILHLLDLQREERTEWKEAFTAAMEEQADVIRELTKAVNESQLRRNGCPPISYQPNQSTH